MQFKVEILPFDKKIGSFISAHHYSKSYPRSVTYCFGLFDGDTLCGICTISHFSRRQSSLRYVRDLELSRFVLVPNLPKNTASFFISRCLKWLKKNTSYAGIVSYSDPTVGHKGTIYKAANFKTLGSTSPSYHYIDKNGHRIHKKKIWRESKELNLKEKTHAKRLGLTKVKELPKIIYRYSLHDEPVKISGYIYKISNSKNEKVYIGKTIHSIERRFNRHCLDAENGSHLPIHCAIRGIGLENFKIEQIDWAEDSNELQKKEAYWIQKYDSLNPSRGYNVASPYSENSFLIPDSVLLESMEMRKQGTPVTEISKILDISYDYLVAVQGGRLRPHLIEKFESEHGPLSRPKQVSEEEKERIMDLFVRGEKIPLIAKTLDVTPHYVRLLVRGRIDPKFLDSYQKRKGIITRSTAREKLSKETIFSILSDYFDNRKSVEEIGSQYKIKRVAVFINRIKKSSFYKEWVRTNGKRPERTRDLKYSDELLMEAFNLKATGLKTPDIAKKLGVSTPYLNAVFRGEQRSHLKTTCPEPKHYKKKANQVKIECVGVGVFNSVKAAADFVGVTSGAILKAIKLEKPCRGYTLKRG